MADDFETTPEWANRLNFKAHSPSAANRPACLEFFTKVIARPQKLRDQFGCNAHGGRVAEEYAKNIVIKKMPVGEAMHHAIAYFDEHEFVEHDADDQIKHGIFRDGIYEPRKAKDAPAGPVGTNLELILKHTAEGLAHAVQGANKVTDGRWVSTKLVSNELYHIGEIDVEAFGGVIEIKTSWPILATNERGFNVRSLPAKPRPDHVRQVALYQHWLKQSSQEKIPVKLVYSNPIGWRVFDNADCEDLSDENLSRAIDDLARIARVREKLMTTAKNSDELFELISPNFDHWMWRNKSPEFWAAAQRIFG